MEPSGLVIFLLVVITVLFGFLLGFMWDAAYYKGHAQAFEQILLKAGLIFEPVVTQVDEGPDE